MTSRGVRLIVPPATVLVALIIASAVAAAADPMPTWRRDGDWSSQERRLNVVADPRGFALESLRSQGGDDVLVGRFDLRDAEYRLELKNASGEGASQHLLVRFSQLIEFRDADGDGRFGAGDPQLRAWRIADTGVPSLEHQPSRDGSHRIVAAYPLTEGISVTGSARPQVELRFQLHPQTRAVAGVPVPPTETKFDLVVTQMRYNASDSRLAAEFQVEGQAPLRLAQDMVQTEEGEYRFAFAWQPTAVVDGFARPVGATVVPGSDTGSTVYLSYARGTNIVHDPSVGASRYEATFLQPVVEILSKGNPGLYVAGLVVAAAVVGGMTFVRMRRR